jgi:lysophospholipase L1-like esterase
MRVLAFGASTMQGYWDSQGGWVDRLKRHYDHLQMKAFTRKDFTDEQPKVMNLGISGDSTIGLLRRIDIEAAARQNAKGVSFLFSIGTNNAGVENGRNISSPLEYRSDLEQLVEKARQYSDKIILVGIHAVNEQLTNPLAWMDLRFTNDRLYEFERAMRDMCQSQNIPHVAVFETFQDEAAKGHNLLAHDGLHPNDDGHELIFQLVRPVLDEVLGR